MRTITPRHHTTRIVKRFALFPISIKSWFQEQKDTRWLEYVKIEQIYYADNNRWKNKRFLDE